MRFTILTSTAFLLIILVIASCTTSRRTGGQVQEISNESSDTLRIINDSIDYEVIIIEPGFNSWLATQPPRGYRSLTAMDVSNDYKIPIYNLRANNPLQYGSQLYPFRIDYDPRIDYGYEVTYLLFNYFNFFEQRYNQRL